MYAVFMSIDTLKVVYAMPSHHRYGMVANMFSSSIKHPKHDRRLYPDRSHARARREDCVPKTVLKQRRVSNSSEPR